MSMRAYFSIRTFNNKEYSWPDPLGDKGEAAVVIEDVGDTIECGRLLAGVDNYPYTILEFFSSNCRFAVEHRHSRLYWDGCAWACTSIENIRYELPNRVRLFVNDQYRMEVDYNQFARVVQNTDEGIGEPRYKCSVAITDPRVRFLVLASLSYFDDKGAKAKCELYKRLNPTRDEAMAVLRRFGLDVGFGPNKADEDTVYGHLNDFCAASKNETPAQILGRTIPLRIECEEPLENGNLNSGMLVLSLANEQVGVVLRGVETVGGVRRTYAFRVPTEWARKCVLNIIEKTLVGLTMRTEQDEGTGQRAIRIINEAGVISLTLGGMIGGTSDSIGRTAKKLRLVYDMLKEESAADVDEPSVRLVGEFKIVNTPMDHIVASLVFKVGKEVCLSRNPNCEGDVLVKEKENGHALGVASPVFGDALNAIHENEWDIKARIASTSILEPSANVVVVRKK